MWKPVFQDISIRMRAGVCEIVLDPACLPPAEFEDLLLMLERVYCATIDITRHDNRVVIKKRWPMQPVETRILVQGLDLFCLVGVPKIERSQRQSIQADIECLLADPHIGPDRMQSTVNYAEIARRAQALVAERRFVLLETLAEALAELCFADARVASVEVSLRKLRKLPSCEAVGIRRKFARG